MSCLCCDDELDEGAKVLLCPPCFQALAVLHDKISNRVACTRHNRRIDPHQVTS